MSCRRQVFRYRDGDATKSVAKSLCRTVHGPVQGEAGRVAYARRYALWKRELETLTGLTALNDARNLADVDRALRQVSWNENTIAADDQGNIGYWHPGLHPLRPLRWDERLPFPGTGEAEWRGLLPRSRDPHVLNPRGRNWLANWNNAPAAQWTSGDAPARKRLNGPFHRIAQLQALVQTAAQAPTFDSVGVGVIRRNAVTAPPVPDRVFPGSSAAAQGAGEPRRHRADHAARVGRELRPHRRRRHRRPGRGDVGGVQGGLPARRARPHDAGQARARQHTGRRGLRRLDPRQDYALRTLETQGPRAAERGRARRPRP